MRQLPEWLTNTQTSLLAVEERCHHYRALPVIQRGKCYHSKCVNTKCSRAPLRELGRKHIKAHYAPVVTGNCFTAYEKKKNEVTFDRDMTAQLVELSRKSRTF